MKKKIANNESGSDYLQLKGFLSFLILHELNLKSLCGDELSKAIGKRRNCVLTPGTIYPALKRLRRKKLIVHRRQGRKKVYSLTESGKKEIEHLYELFSVYFYGLKNKIVRNVRSKRESIKRK